MLRYRASRCLCRLLSSQAAATTDAAPSGSTQMPFTLPKKIKRGPTDLLKALSETVGEDPTAPQYAFIDDPTLVPSQANLRRTAFLAREMGRRAAREIATEWPTLFMYDRDEPRMNAFRPTKLPPIDQVDPTEQNLRERIDAKRVVDAAALYERMRAADVDVSVELQRDLFELLAFYNGADPPLIESDLPGVRMFHADGPIFQRSQGQPTIWQTGGVADLLFEVLDQNDPRLCSTMIAGLCKFRSDESVKRAWQLLQTMREKSLKPTVEAYEWLLRACFQLKEDRPVNESVSLIFDYMAHDGVKPTVGIFNAALLTLTNDKEMVKKIFGEMLALNVQPSLTTYRLVLASACVKSAEEAVNYLHQILIKLEALDEIAVVHRTDFEFYVVAMEIARKASSLSLAERIQALYLSRKNKVQLPGLVDDDEFFGEYLRLLIAEVHSSRMSLEDFDKRYRKIVPRHVAMTTDLIFECGDLLKNKRNAPLALRFIDDIIASGFLLFSTGNRQIFSLIKGSDPKSLPPDQFAAMEAVLLRVVGLIDTFATHNNPKVRRKWSPQNLAMASVALARFKQTARAWQLFNKLMPTQSTFGATTDTMEMEAAARAEVEDFGFAERSDIEEMFDLALDTNDFVNACNSIEIFARYNNSSMNWMLNKIKSRLALSPPQLRIVENFIRLRDTQ